MGYDWGSVVVDQIDRIEGREEKKQAHKKIITEQEEPQLCHGQMASHSEIS